MNAMHGGGPGDEYPDFDLDQPAGDDGDAQVRALFRDGLRPRPGTAPAVPDLRGIERRAKQRHRRHQAMASGAVTAAAALAAVLVVVSPWSGGGTGQGVPASPSPHYLPTPSATTGLDTSVPDVTRASLIHAADLGATDGDLGILPENATFAATGDPENLSGEKVVEGICVDDTLTVNAPERAWQQMWESQDDSVPPRYAVTETVLQWPGDPDEASWMAEELRSQLADCEKGPGLEGRGVTHEVDLGDATTTAPTMVTTAADGQGGALAQAVTVWGDTVIVIDFQGAGEALGDSSGDPEAPAGNSTLTMAAIAVTRLAGQDPGGPPFASPLWANAGSEVEK
ncbi:hypothetical protein [Kineosporia corallincola]|uniref:hypothetical protein n=1 Tax=Kineosporia corallincola TaxID=2835133 RepID=UPI001FE79968|nr:hypothetical protein [Kineosporia corallincola]